MKREVELAKRLLESKGYTVSRLKESSYTYSGHNVSDDLQQYLVTVVLGGTDGDRETGMIAPDYYTELVSAIDEEDAKHQVEKVLDPGDGITDVHLATPEEIAEWEHSAYEYMDESKKMNESDCLKYISNVNGYSTYRKIENGKGIWFAKRQDDPDDKMFPITYDQARGFKEMPDEKEIEKLRRKMGDILLPKDESKNITESSSSEYYYLKDIIDTWNIVEKYDLPNTETPKGIRVYKKDYDDLMKSVKNPRYLKNLIRPLKESKIKESTDIPHTEQYKGYSIQSYDEYGATLYKNGKKVQEFENIDDARYYIDEINESIDISSDDKFKVGDIISYSMLYGGIVTAEVVDRSDDKLTLKEKWTAEDTGERASNEEVYDIESKDGVEYIIVWEYHGHEGRAYPPNSKFAN